MATLLRRKPVLTAAPIRVFKTPTTKEELDALKIKLRRSAGMSIPENIDHPDAYAETIKRYRDKVHNPKSAIRAKCVECSGGSLKEVAECRVVKCALYPFRMGENPFHKKTRERLAGESEGNGESDDE